MFFLDSYVVIGVMNGRAPDLVARVEAELERGTRLLLSMIVLYELRYGASQSAYPERNHARVDDFLACITELTPFDAQDAAEAGGIRTYLARKGSPIGPYDVLIAAQARRRNLPLVTINQRELKRVPGLVVADWSSP